MVSRIETISDPSRTIVSYDDVAPAYDADRFGPRPGRYDFQETSVLVNILLADLLADRSGWRALDVACGTGKIAVTAARAGGKVVACDASVPMLQRCEANARKADVKGVLRAAAADAARLPFPDNVFDIVFSFRFLHLLSK